MRKLRKTPTAQVFKDLRLPPGKATEAAIKAQLITAVLKAVEEQGLTHEALAKRSGFARSAVTGILSGSLQRVTIDRVLRLVAAAGLEAEVKVKAA